MAIFDTTKNDVSQRRTDKDHPLEQFKGVDAQLVVDTNDNYRIAVMNGKTLGGVAHVALLESAPFKRHPTTATTSDLNAIKPNMLVAKSEVEAIIRKQLGLNDSTSNPDEDVTLNDLLNGKIDHTKPAERNNLDELVEDGFYSVLESAHAPANIKGYVHVIADKDRDCLYQFFFGDTASSPRIWVRKRLFSTGAWSTWFEGIYLENVNTLVLTDKANTFIDDAIFKKNVRIEGDLISPTLEAKADHTKTSVIDDLNILINDGGFYYDGSFGVSNKPDSTMVEFFVFVLSQNSAVYQIVYGVNKSGIWFRRKPNSSTWSEWEQNAGSETLDATLDRKGIVQLTSVINNNETMAITPKAVDYVLRKANAALVNAEANEKTITELAANIGTIIKEITIPNSENSTDYDSLEVDDNGVVRLPLASPSHWGLARPATAKEMQEGKDIVAFVTPNLIEANLTDKVEEVLDKVLGGGGSGGDSGSTIIDNIANNITNNENFINDFVTNEKVTETIKKTVTDSVKETITSDREVTGTLTETLAPKVVDKLKETNQLFETIVMNESEFVESNAKQNTLYLLVE